MTEAVLFWGLLLVSVGLVAAVFAFALIDGRQRRRLAQMQREIEIELDRVSNRDVLRSGRIGAGKPSSRVESIKAVRRTDTSSGFAYDPVVHAMLYQQSHSSDPQPHQPAPDCTPQPDTSSPSIDTTSSCVDTSPSTGGTDFSSY